MGLAKAGTAAVVVAVILMPAAGHAQDLPKWSIAEICAKEQPQCAAFEGRAQRAVSGGWAVLPEAYRKACLAAVSSPLDRSWRALSECLEGQVYKALDKQAIATSATPSEPVPPPQPMSAAPADVPGMPAPPFGVPTVAPKIE